MSQIPNYQPGTYVIDPVHSDVSFSIRHMMVAKVRGRFDDVAGTIVLGATPEESTVTATVDPASIDTRNADRDNHLRSGDFFATSEFPTWTFTSTGVRASGDEFLIDGDLQIKGVTKQVTLTVDPGGIGKDTYGQTRAGASASITINRQDFGITFNVALEQGGVMLGDDVQVSIDISAVLQDAE